MVLSLLIYEHGMPLLYICIYIGIYIYAPHIRYLSILYITEWKEELKNEISKRMGARAHQGSGEQEVM